MTSLHHHLHSLPFWSAQPRARRGRWLLWTVRRFWTVHCFVSMLLLSALLFLAYLSVFGGQLPSHRAYLAVNLDLYNVKGHPTYKIQEGDPTLVHKYKSPKRKQTPHGNDIYEPRFGGHQTLNEREKSFYARNQRIHCGFIRGPKEYPSTGFDLDDADKEYMHSCKIAVSSCIFGNSDFLRRPTSSKIDAYSKGHVCFVMFLDELTMSQLALEGNVPDDRGYVGLWKLVLVKNLPYTDMRKTGKVPKFLSHRLFPLARYSIWIDSKMRLDADPVLILEYFLWRKKSEYAISNHYDRHCVWEEVLQNKRLNKYNHSAIDEQFLFYQSDGLVKFDVFDKNIPLPSYVPEGSFIVRAHTPMSNLFSCLWFNEVDRFTSRDQLSFGYTFLKLKNMNPEKKIHFNMFKTAANLRH